jgi:hypothetical protein
MDSERRHGVEELAEKLAKVEATLEAHVVQEDRDRRELINTLTCIKSGQANLAAEINTFKGRTGAIMWGVGIMVAGAAAIAGWMR